MRFDEKYAERFPAMVRIVCERTKPRRRVAGCSTRNVMTLAAPQSGKFLASYPVLTEAVIRECYRDGQKSETYAQMLQIHNSCTDPTFRILSQSSRSTAYIPGRKAFLMQVNIFSFPTGALASRHRRPATPRSPGRLPAAL